VSVAAHVYLGMHFCGQTTGVKQASASAFLLDDLGARVLLRVLVPSSQQLVYSVGVLYVDAVQSTEIVVNVVETGDAYGHGLDYHLRVSASEWLRGCGYVAHELGVLAALLPALVFAIDGFSKLRSDESRAGECVLAHDWVGVPVGDCNVDVGVPIH